MSKGKDGEELGNESNEKPALRASPFGGSSNPFAGGAAKLKKTNVVEKSNKISQPISQGEYLSGPPLPNSQATNYAPSSMVDISGLSVEELKARQAQLSRIIAERTRLPEETKESYFDKIAGITREKSSDKKNHPGSYKFRIAADGIFSSVATDISLGIVGDSFSIKIGSDVASDPLPFNFNNPNGSAVRDLISSGEINIQNQRMVLQYAYDEGLLPSEKLTIMAGVEKSAPLLQVSSSESIQEIRDWKNEKLDAELNKVRNSPNNIKFQTSDNQTLKLYLESRPLEKPNPYGVDNRLNDMICIIAKNKDDISNKMQELGSLINQALTESNPEILSAKLSEMQNMKHCYFNHDVLKDFVKSTATAENTAFNASIKTKANRVDAMSAADITYLISNTSKNLGDKAKPPLFPAFNHISAFLKSIESAELVFKILTESTPEQRHHIRKNMLAQPLSGLKQPGGLRSPSPSRSSSPANSSDSGVTDRNSSEKSSGSPSPTNTIQVTRSTISVEDALAMVKSNPRSSSPLKAGTEQEAQKASSLHPTDTVTSSTAKKTRGRRDL